MPATATSAPIPIAPSREPRKLVNRFCAVATGITIMALTSISPTVRMLIVTVRAASTTTIRFIHRTRSPSTRLKSSSAQMANSWGDRPTQSTTTTRASAATAHTSASDSVVSEPNRNWDSAPAP